MSRILLAEDEERIASFVQKGLRSAGYAVTVAATGLDALSYAKSGQFDLLILDVGLPGIDGFEVLRRVRADGDDLVVIMLTARSGVEDTVHGLENGANDYVAKPFKFDELLARVRLRLRESGDRTGMELSRGDLTLDLRSRRVRVADRTVELSAREFALAEEFLRHPYHVLSREQLLSRVWGWISIRVPTSSTSTCGTCGRKWELRGSRPSGASAIA